MSKAAQSITVKGILERIARRVMKERGFLPDFSKAALNELEKIQQVDREGEISPEGLAPPALGID